MWYEIIRDIKQDVGRVANKIARGVAAVALEDLKEAHSSIMDSFYSGYTPVDSYKYEGVKGDQHWIGTSHGYRRTGNLRNNSFQSLGVTQVGTNGFKATVYVGPDNMDNYVNSTNHEFPADVVFDLIWNQGVRGLPPGYRGYIGLIQINSSPVGIGISGIPVKAMCEFVNKWGQSRGAEVADAIAHSL